ncbi:MAG: hypothetical protein IJU84_08515 [Clostridia bacterium]|nr:hypothetical protein [Clostridia bacterium]
MKVVINGEKRRFSLFLPLWSISGVMRAANVKGVKSLGRKFYKALKKYKKKYGGFTLLEAESADGTRVTVTV